MWEYEAVIDALEGQEPLWPRETGHGYHPRTFGFLLDEMVRRLSGIPLSEYWRREFAESLSLDFWIGVPDEVIPRVAPIFAPRTVPRQDEFLRAFADSGSLTNRAFSSPKGLQTSLAMNTPEARGASFPACGGIGTARAVGKFYAMLANGGMLEGRRYFAPELCASTSTPLTNGHDKVLCTETAFSAGFMQDPLDGHGRKLRMTFGPSLRAFGHPGAGGSVAFADPENGIAFAYVMNQMDPGVLPSGKARALIDALYR